MIKRVVYCLYAHKSNIDELKTKLNECQKEVFERVLFALGKNIENYDIIKFDCKKNTVSFIKSQDWDYVNEPTVGESICVDSQGIILSKRKGGNQVYHNKWSFVSDSYKGFDIEEAKKRTELWSSIPNISRIKSQIGNKSFWENLLKENGINV